MTNPLPSLAWIAFLLFGSAYQSLAQQPTPFYSMTRTVSEIDRTMPVSPGGPRLLGSRLLGHGVTPIAPADEPTGAIPSIPTNLCSTDNNAQTGGDCATLVELIQVGSFRSRDEAEQEAARFAQEHGTTLGALIPSVKQATIGSNNDVYFRLRYSGFRAQNTPTKICSQLTAKGEHCLALRR